VKGLIEILFGGFEVFGFLLLALFVGTLSYRYHLAVHLNVIYHQSVDSLIFSNLLSASYNKTFTVYRIISERELIGGLDEDMKNNITKFVHDLSNEWCYELKTSDGEILSKNESKACENVQMNHVVYGFVFKPYNPTKLVEILELRYHGD